MNIGLTIAPCSRRYSVWLVSLLLPLLLLFQKAAVVVSLTVKVCQNKDCCRRFQGQSSLPRILKDLSLVNIATTGCLSQCNKGPNVVVDKDQYLHGLVDPMTVVAALEPLCGPFAPKLKAAMQVMERGQQSGLTYSEKEAQFGSVIRSLGGDTEFCQSSAYAHALALRASTRCSARDYESALQDTQSGLQVLLDTNYGNDKKKTTAPHNVDLLSKLYRSQADAYEGLGLLNEAIQALQMWSACDPSFRTKIIAEIKRLQERQ